MLTHCTLTGIDARTSMFELEDLARSFPFVEFGFLYSRSNEIRNRYMGFDDLLRKALLARNACGDRLALHICGAPARIEFFHGRIERHLLACFKRIQINGEVPYQIDYDQIENACDMLPEKVIITQQRAGQLFPYREFSRPEGELLTVPDVPSENHAVLIDGSGGRGIMPANWVRPPTTKAVGFAGGLGPQNIREELPRIVQAAGTEGEWWIDMEQGIRTEDWFCHHRAKAVCNVVKWATMRESF